MPDHKTHTDGKLRDFCGVYVVTDDDAGGLAITMGVVDIKGSS